MVTAVVTVAGADGTAPAGVLGAPRRGAPTNPPPPHPPPSLKPLPLSFFCRPARRPRPHAKYYRDGGGSGGGRGGGPGGGGVAGGAGGAPTPGGRDGGHRGVGGEPQCPPPPARASLGCGGFLILPIPFLLQCVRLAPPLLLFPFPPAPGRGRYGPHSEAGILCLGRGA